MKQLFEVHQQTITDNFHLSCSVNMIYEYQNLYTP